MKDAVDGDANIVTRIVLLQTYARDLSTFKCTYLQMAWYLHFLQEDLFANPEIEAVHGR